MKKLMKPRIRLAEDVSGLQESDLTQLGSLGIR